MMAITGGFSRPFPKTSGVKKRRRCQYCKEWVEVKNLNKVIVTCDACVKKGRKRT